MLMRVDRLDDAEAWFERGAKIAPKSPLPLEGLGLLASEREQHAKAIENFRAAAALGPLTFLSHYTWGKALLQSTAKRKDTFTRPSAPIAAEIKSEFQKSLALMPDFGPAHELLGFVLMVEDEDLAAAERHLQRAIELEPENQAYLFSLAQLQWRRNNVAAARRTLEPLRLTYADPRLRAHAEEMLKEMAGPEADAIK
jgi:tetratricopeptide (TPR) repeat protein